MIDVYPVALGRAVACLRMERGMKRKDLVAAAGVSYPYLAEIEDGRKTPSSAMLAKIADALETKPSLVMAMAENIINDPRNGLA